MVWTLGVIECAAYCFKDVVGGIKSKACEGRRPKFGQADGVKVALGSRRKTVPVGAARQCAHDRQELELD